MTKVYLFAHNCCSDVSLVRQLCCCEFITNRLDSGSQAPSSKGGTVALGQKHQL